MSYISADSLGLGGVRGIPLSSLTTVRSIPSSAFSTHGPPSRSHREEGFQNVSGANHAVPICDWDAGYHRMITDGHPLFMTRRYAGDLQYVGVNLPCANQVLLSGYEAGRRTIQEDVTKTGEDFRPTRDDVEEINRAFLAEFGEGYLFNAENADTYYRQALADLDVLQDSAPDGGGANLEAAREALEKVKLDASMEAAATVRKATMFDRTGNATRYLSGVAIKRFWNLYGVVVANNRENTAEDRSLPAYDPSTHQYVRSDAVALTVAVARTAQVVNHWANEDALELHQRLFFCVQRRPRTSDGQGGGFCFKPVYGHDLYTVPSRAECSYVDDSGSVQYVVPYQMGLLKGKSLSDRRSPASSVLASQGIQNSLENAMDAIGLVGRLTIEVDVMQEAWGCY